MEVEHEFRGINAPVGFTYEYFNSISLDGLAREALDINDYVKAGELFIRAGESLSSSYYNKFKASCFANAYKALSRVPSVDLSDLKSVIKRTLNDYFNHLMPDCLDSELNDSWVRESFSDFIGLGLFDGL